MKKNFIYILLIGFTLMFTACPEDADVIPIACFEPSASEIGVGDLITFSNCSQDAEYYSWNFGDGGTSTEVSPAYSYNNAGTYTVTLTANNKSNTNIYSETIQVINSDLEPDLYNGIPSEYYSDYVIEDFNSETSFVVDESSDRSAKLVEGVYKVTVFASSDWIFWSQEYNPGNNKNYEIEFSIRHVDYSDLFGSGIVWGSNDDANKFYFYFIYPDGEYLAGYYANEWNQWFDFQYGGNELPYWNNVTLRKVGNTHYGFLNEELVFEEDFDGNFGNNFGLYVATGSTVEYDYFNTYLIGTKKSGSIPKAESKRLKEKSVNALQLKR